MTRVFVLVLALVMLGCATGGGLTPGAPFTKGADSVSFPRGLAFKVYSDLRVSYAVLAFRLSLACKNGMLEPDLCTRELPRIDEEMKRIDRKIMEALANPVVEVDWEAVGEAVRIIIKIAEIVT
jgi:hypothetical protein